MRSCDIKNKKTYVSIIDYNKDLYECQAFFIVVFVFCLNVYFMTFN